MKNAIKQHFMTFSPTHTDTLAHTQAHKFDLNACVCHLVVAAFALASNLRLKSSRTPHSISINRSTHSTDE